MGLVFLFLDLLVNRMEFPFWVAKFMFVFACLYMGLMVFWSCTFEDLYEGVRWCSDDLSGLIAVGLFLYFIFMCLWLGFGLLNLAKFKFWAGENVLE